MRTFSPGARFSPRTKGPSLSIPTHTPRRLSTPPLTPFDSAPTFVASRAAAAAAQKKAKALGRQHPEYATTLFHMAEAKRAGGDAAAAAVLLEESLRISDAAGRGDGSTALQARSISHWSPYDRVGVVNADP